jgi:probable rRNA maturation factor
MLIDVEFNNREKSPVRSGFLKKVVQATLENCGLEFLTKKKMCVGVATVGSEEMKKLNREYRKIDEATDVLSFAEYRSEAEFEAIGDKEVYLGEIILCYNNIKDYSVGKNIDPKKELARVFAHGVLHLLAFRHGKKMFDIQDKVATQCTSRTKC